MKNRSAALTLWANRFLMMVVAGLACGMPRLLRWYNRFRPLEDKNNLALLIGFYLCVPIVLFALYNLETEKNVTSSMTRILWKNCLPLSETKKDA